MKLKISKYWLWVAGVWAVWGGLTATAWLFIFQPQGQEYAKIHKELRTRADELELAKTASQESTRHRQIEALEQTLRELDGFTIGPRQQDRLVFEVSRLASDLNLEKYAGESCGNIEKSFQADAKAPIERMFLDVTFTGPFTAFARFINTLERNEPILFVQNASVERAMDGSGRHEVRLLLSMLIQKDPITVPEIARATARQRVLGTDAGQERL